MFLAFHLILYLHSTANSRHPRIALHSTCWNVPLRSPRAHPWKMVILCILGLLLFLERNKKQPYRPPQDLTISFSGHIYADGALLVITFSPRPFKNAKAEAMQCLYSLAAKNNYKLTPLRIPSAPNDFFHHMNILAFKVNIIGTVKFSVPTTPTKASTKPTATAPPLNRAVQCSGLHRKTVVVETKYATHPESVAITEDVNSLLARD